MKKTLLRIVTGLRCKCESILRNVFYGCEIKYLL